MSEQPRIWSRRRLLQYSSVGIGLAIAGCNGGDSSEDEPDDGEDEPDDGSSENPSEDFELAGDGSVGFREWLGPEYIIDSPESGESRQLYQFIDYGEIPDGEMENQRERRQNFADQLGIEADNIERELLLGPVEGSLPYRALFGSFDAEALIESFENSGFERTDELGNFVVLDGSFAISSEMIIEHPSSAALIEGHREGYPPFDEFDEEMQLLLDLVPAGPQVTINSRDDHKDVVLDGQTILELNGSVVTHSIRTLIFEDASAATSERVRALDIDGSARNEVVTEEINGRVAMIESRRV